jgi:hypothetical protein
MGTGYSTSKLLERTVDCSGHLTACPGEITTVFRGSRTNGVVEAACASCAAVRNCPPKRGGPTETQGWVKSLILEIRP